MQAVNLFRTVVREVALLVLLATFLAIVVKQPAPESPCTNATVEMEARP